MAVTGSSGLIGSALCAYSDHRRARRRPPGPARAAWPVGARLGSGATRPGRARRCRCGGASRRRVHRRPLHRGAQATRARESGRAHGSAGPASGRPAPTGRACSCCASAIGFYGADRGDEELTEESGRGSGFLADLVEDWEAATDPARAAGVRVVHVRTGIVQSARGASLKLLRPLFAAGLGGPLAPGSQWVSWIDLDDLLDVFGLALADDALAGPVNAVAPLPVTNRDYARDPGPRDAAARRSLRSPPSVPSCSSAPRAPAKSSRPARRVVPARLAEAGHVFRHPSLESCLRHQLGHVDTALEGEELGR